MLRILGYLALIAAFFLPWTVGELVKSVKTHNRRNRLRWTLLCAGCVLILALTVVLAAVLSGQNP